MLTKSLDMGAPHELFDLGRSHQAEGRRSEAKVIYEKILRQAPQHGAALTLLGSIAYQDGDEIQAEAYLDRAIEVYLRILQQQPAVMEFRASAANLLLARNRVPEAESLIASLRLPLNPIRSTAQEFAARRNAANERGVPGLLFNTIPKSASESIWNRLAEGLGLAQSHISLGLFPACTVVPQRVAELKLGGFIAKEHLAASTFNIKALADQGIDRLVFNLRDPRQATLSWVYFVREDVSMRLMGPIWRRTVPPAEVLRADFTVLLDWCIKHYLATLVEMVQGWRRLRQDAGAAIRIAFQSFEQYVEAPQSYIEAFLDFNGLSEDLFASDAMAETIHLRKGMKDEWRDVFSKSQKDRAWKAIPRDMAEEFGWRR